MYYFINTYCSILFVMFDVFICLILYILCFKPCINIVVFEYSTAHIIYQKLVLQCLHHAVILHYYTSEYKLNHALFRLWWHTSTEYTLLLRSIRLYSTQLASKWGNITKLINATICNNSEIVLTALDVATTLCNALRQQIQ